METPLSREYLRGLKAQNDEAIRIRNIQNYAQHIYREVEQIAKTTTQTRFQQQVRNDNTQFSMRDNVSDILGRLRSMFPDSKVDFKSLSRGQDGKMYDIADIDERMKPFIDTRYNQDFIIVDWS
jgi:hypothetical protein